MKILILGSSGLLGSKLLDKLSPRHEVTGTFFSTSLKAETYKNVFHLDATRHQVVEQALINLNPDVVIYAASISRPDLCEQNKDLATAVNFEGLRNVASICASLRKKIVYISTDQVFSGSRDHEYRESDEPDPINHYGRSKLMAEEFLRAHIPNHIIIRPTMMYGYALLTENRGLVNSLLQEIDASKESILDSFRPQFPVLADDVCDLITKLLELDETGTFHISSEEGFSKYEIGLMVAETYGLPHKHLVAREETNDQLIAVRPDRVKLNTSKIRHLGVAVTNFDKGIHIHRRQNGCMFRLIYSARPDMLVAGQNASEFRINAGRALVQESPLPNDIDCVIPIPESGIYSATGIAAESGHPLFFGIIRDYFTEKTLYSQTQNTRKQALKRKLIPVEAIIRGKKIVLVDEAVLSGTTLAVVVDSLRSVGVNEIHIRIPSPIMANACTGKILEKLDLQYTRLFPAKDADKERFEEALARAIGVDSVRFLSLEKFLSLTSHQSNFCSDCFLKRSSVNPEP